MTVLIYAEALLMLHTYVVVLYGISCVVKFDPYIQECILKAMDR